MKSYASPLKKARGLGSVKEGGHEFVLQRFFAVILVPLTIWFMVSICKLASDSSYENAIAFFSKPCAIVITIALLTVSFYHAALGVKMVVEDYVHCNIKKNITLYIVNSICFLATVAGILSILSIYFKG